MIHNPRPVPALTPTDFYHLRCDRWRTIGIKRTALHTLRLQLDNITCLRRVQRRILGLFWRTLPEPEAFREALLWNWHSRPARKDGGFYAQSVFMELPLNAQWLPLDHPWAERFIVNLYADVRADCEWYDEGRCKWRPISEFFGERK
jgi:hypothetical protein